MNVKKGSLTFKSFEMIDLFLLKIFGYFSKMNLEKTINYFSINGDDNSISLTPNNAIRLYAIKLETRSNRTIRTYDFEGFCNDIKHDKDGTEVMLSFVKQRNVEAIYLFTSSKKIALAMSKKFETKLLESYEILSALYHIFLLDVFEIKGRRIYNKYNDIKHTQDIDLLYKQFPSLISIAADNMLQKYTPYQITAFKDREDFSIINLFRTEWYGVCHLFFDFSSSKANGRLALLEQGAKLGDSSYLKEYNSFVNNPENKESVIRLREHCFIGHGIFFLEDRAVTSSFQDALGVVAEERYYSMDKILPRTLLLTRDIDFDILMENKNIGKYFSTSLCKECLKDVEDKGEVILKPDFFGTDINGNFFNFMFKGNSSPHALIFGTTGAGKSVAALKMLTQIIDYDFENKVARDLHSERKIRYINVGYTGGRIFENIKKNSTDKKIIEIIPSSVSNLRFNLFDFEDMNNPTEEEQSMFVNFINLILDVSSSDTERTLSGSEENALWNSVLKMIAEKRYANLSLGEIQGSYPRVYDEIIEEILNIKDENGQPKFSLRTKADELPSEYERFKKPILADLINTVIAGMNDMNKTSLEKTVYQTLKQKLENIKNIAAFAYFNNVVVRDNYPAYYVDFDKIKDDRKSFVAIGWLLIKNWFKYDKMQALKAFNNNERRPDSFYFVEEAHNFLKIPVFEDLIKTFAKEVRKYGVHLVLITQSVSDITPGLAELFSTKCFLFKELDKGNAQQGVIIVNGNAELDPSSQEVFDKIKDDADDDRTIFMMHSNGVNAFKLPRYKQYQNLFLPYDIG
ncbi:ATP-binding protein [Campylobacter sp. RM16188]|uniref:ATP-binding protein n=1 Tax=Campylobacter sp. RM16188 TaxID=1705725 RepID=UPI001551F131|nr:ATP-binding protein [Campylobacter sp. RM16188]